MTYTPGPWFATDNRNEDTARQITVDSLTEGAVAVCAPSDAGLSNARLMAAAPELLAALEWLLNDPHSERGLHTAITYAEFAIQKATAPQTLET